MPLLSFSEYVLMSPEALTTLRDAYIQDVTLEGTWGAEVEARHLAQLFGITLVFWTEGRDHTFQTIHRYGEGPQTLHLLNQGHHFEALRLAPTLGAPFTRAQVVPNSGGGDCLYRAFHQAVRRGDEEPSHIALSTYRSLVASNMRREPELDLEGMLTVLLDEFSKWGFALGAGTALQNAIFTLYGAYARSDIAGGGSIPPHGRKPRGDLKIGMRDFVPRGELSRADRLLDRIGRLISTTASVHVAVALDGNALVMSANADTDNVRSALENLIARYGQSAGVGDDDPLHGRAESTFRVKPDASFKPTAKPTKYRRDVDINKMKALRSGILEELSSGLTLEKLQKIKAALGVGLFRAGTRTAKQQYLDGDTGIYLIPHHDDGSRAVIHGEMNVTTAIQERRLGKGLKDSVFIGGTLIDCFDCNKAHKSRNEALKKQAEGWLFYSGGTHGNSFPNWYLTPEHSRHLDEATFQLERFPGSSQRADWYDRYDNRSGEYGYWTPTTVRQYFYNRRDGTKVLTPHKTDLRGRDNRYDLVTKDVLVWETTPRTYLTKLFLRDRAKLHIDNSHKTFPDDSDSDTDEYDVLLKDKARGKKRFRKALRKSYADVRGASLCDLFTNDPRFSLSVSLPTAQKRPLLHAALRLYTGRVSSSQASLLLPNPDLLELLTNFSPGNLEGLFAFARRSMFPSSQPLPSSATVALRTLGERYTFQLRPVQGALTSLSSIWVLPVGADTALASDGGPSFNLGGLYSLFSLVTCALGRFTVDDTAPLSDIWDGLFQATLHAYAEHRLEDWAFVLQVRILGYLKMVLLVTPLGDCSLRQVLQCAQQRGA